MKLLINFGSDGISIPIEFYYALRERQNLFEEILKNKISLVCTNNNNIFLCAKDARAYKSYKARNEKSPCHKSLISHSGMSANAIQRALN